MGRDNSHDAFSNDPNMNVSVAPTLGVKWMTNLLSADVGGATIAFNPTLGQTLVYTGDERGNASAYNEATGQTVWTTLIGAGDSIYSTPMVSSDEQSVWVGTVFNSHLWKLDAATGAIDCSQKTQLAVQGSPTEGTSSNGTPLVYASAIDGPGIAGPELAIAESNCAIVFSSNPYKVPYTGSWASAAYGVDANGRSLVFQGTADPDSGMYAMDATSGALDWSFSTGLSGDYDIGAAATVSAPGNNGFAHGVLYFIDKKQIAYALDLTTGALIWQYDFGKDAGQPSGNARSSAALDGNTIVFGMSNGVYALNATTGAKLWHYIDPAQVEVISNPAVVGPPGQEVVAFGDLAGAFHVLSLAAGTELYHYQTGNYITSSPSYVNGHFLIASTDGFLYDFSPGGGNGAAPKTAITSPTQGSTNPYSSVVAVTGTATDAVGVNAVQVAVQSGGSSGPWYDSTTNSWGNGAMTNLIAVSNPGSITSNWTFSIPIPPSGATLHVYANAVNVGQQVDKVGRQTSFSVSYSPSAPQLQSSAVFVAPAGALSVSGSGFSPHEGVKFTLGSTVVGNANATATGVVSATLKIPAKTTFGPTSITATGGKSKRIAIAPIDIANTWLEAGNDPGHSGFEPNDSVFAGVISPGNNNYLSMAWYYSMPVAVESSPAVYQSQIFFGDDAGTLSAVQADTAAPVWSVNIPSGAAIRSTPAIDPATGNLTFTADDGGVYVVTTATGAGVGSATIGGLLTSPTVSNGAIYVGSDNASVSALSEQTGSLLWSRLLSGAVHAAPALDTATGVLVVGDDSGAISALNGTTGTVIWQALTGGPVMSAPTIAGGIVYAGSSDGKLYALNEQSGAVLWAYATGTALTTGSAYDPNLKLVYAGGANGTLYAVNATTGTLAWTTIPLRSPLSPYVGIGAATSLVFADIASGSLISYRSSQFGRFNSNHKTAGALTTAPAVNDGTVFVGASDGGVYAYTTTGSAPQITPQNIRQAAARLAAQGRRSAWRTFQRVFPHFSWAGQRDVPLHIDSIRRTARVTQAPLAYHGGPVQTDAARSYVIFWKPAGSALEKRYIPSIVSALRDKRKLATGNAIAGTYIDTSAYPAQLSDGTLQAEITRAIAVNHWTAGINARFFVLTANGAIAPNAGFCSYHSAFAPGHDRSKFVVYGIVPYSGAAGACQAPAVLTLTGDQAVDAAVVNLARVQRELSNDPLLNGWYDKTGSELGPTF